jgi:hypothetical protein
MGVSLKDAKTINDNDFDTANGNPLVVFPGLRGIPGQAFGRRHPLPLARRAS